MFSRHAFRAAALAAAFPLALTAAGMADAAGAASIVPAANPSAEVSAGDTDLSRPDSVSAMVTARATGKRVEDLSQRTETELVYANPDGTWTSEQDTEPTRMQDDAGEWHDIDTTLVERDGHLEPKYAASDLELSAGGNKVFAALSEDGKDLAWKWDSVLPEPTVEGDTATYVGAVDGGDLVVTATATGFSHSVVLRERPADLEALSSDLAAEPEASSTLSPSAPSAPSSEPTTAPDVVQFSMPVVTDGAKLTEAGNGSLQVRTASGDVVAVAPKPLMWDSSENSQGDHANVVPVEATVTQAGATTPEGTTAGANPVLTLTPDQEFLADPDTKYPVTIDPSFTTYTNGDTWIENNGYTNSQLSDPDLLVGTYDSGTHIARSYLTFSSSGISGQHVVKATLWMRNWWATNCTAANINVSRITESWSVSGVSWATRPNFTDTGMAYFSPAYGASGCPANGANWNVTSIVDGWASGAFPNYGLQVRGNTETYNGTWRRYRSANYSDPDVRPRLIVTYNRAPSIPTQPSVAAMATYSPPGSSTSTNYVATKRPTFTATTTDADGGSPTTTFSVYNATNNALVASCSKAAAAGSRASCTLTSDLPDGGSYYVSATAYDGYDYSGGLRLAAANAKPSAKTNFTVAATQPAAPVISCPGYADGSWTTTPPPGGSVTCTVSATGSGANAPGSIEYSLDQHAAQSVTIPQSSDAATAKIQVQVPTTDGGHGIDAVAVSPSGIKSSANDFGFGWGQVALSLPLADQVQTTTDTVALEAAGPKSGDGTSNVTASVRWRVAGTSLDEDHGWNTDTDTDLTVTNGAAGVHVTGTWNTRQADQDTSSGTGTITLDPDRPVLLDVQVCVDYPGTQVNEHCTWATPDSRRQVLRVAHAFGGNFPTSDVPGGQVALFTGELAVGDSDATVGAPAADLSVSRTASSFAGPVANPANQVFGPGWNASLDGPDAGMGDMTLVDNTLVDGTLQLVDGVGTAMIFGATETPARRTGADLTVGDWVALDEDTELSATRLTVNSSGTVTVTEDDGTATTYGVKTAPTATSAGVYTVSKINEASAEGATTYSRDSEGRITRMLAPVPAGVDCDNGMVDGCRALTITYATATTAAAGVDGEVEGQVQKIEQVIGNGTPTILATYAYDNDHRLVAATDARSGLVTAYTYDGSSDRLASVTPAGLAKISYTYAPSSHKLTRVTRPLPSGGTANLATVVYGVPTHGHTGLPDLAGSDVAAWGQSATQAPSGAAAVFGPDQPLGTSDTVTVSDVDASASGGAAWRDADLSYFDADGRTTNSAEFGAGQWLLTSAAYDDQDNVVRSLDESDIAAIQAGDLLPSQAGDVTVYNDEVKNGAGGVVLAAGSVVVDTYATARWIRNTSGTMVWASPHSHTTYDEGAPNGGINPDTNQRYALPTTVVSNAVDPASGTVADTYGTTTTGYDNAILGGTADGAWKMGMAGDITAVMAGSPGSQTDVTSRTRYDATGRVVETRQPKSAGGGDAGTRQTLYYTAGAQVGTRCGGKPAWAGAICQTTYAGTASGSNPSLVTTTITSYDELLNPLVTEETANGATRTTTNTYKANGEPESSTVTTSGLTGSSPSTTGVGRTSFAYDPATGLQTSVTTDAAGGNPGGVVTTAYDSWGRETTYTITNNGSSSETTMTEYNNDGDVATVTDPQGTTTYTYDGTDAAGKEEHRSLATKVSITRATGGALDFTGAYDTSGALSRQNLPGGLIQRVSYDTAGEPTGLSYSGPVAITDVDGNVTGTDPDGSWLAWSQDNDAQGRVRREWTPTGGALTGDLTGAAATGFARDYTYDRAARLVSVKDQTLASAGGGTGAGDGGVTGIASAVCQVRDYAFDANGNRTSKTVTTGVAGAACPTSGGTTKSWTYDNADRITNTGYVYDQLGRQTSISQVDTPLAAAGGTPGAMSLGYYDDDSIKSLAQNGTTTTFRLDAGGRRATSTATPATGAATTTVRHYVDGSDNPGWASTTTGTGTATTERYAEDLGGGLGVTISNSGTTQTSSLALADLHGDTVTTVDLPASGSPTGLASWSDSDEYGNNLVGSTTGKTPTNSGGVADGLGYGWLGGKQRATDTTGMVLMGARAYNPCTGTFTSTDPIYGGNTTTYAYPQDPVNGYDLSGQMRNDTSGQAYHYTPNPNPYPKVSKPKKEHHSSFFGGITHSVTKAVSATVKNVKKHRKLAGAILGGVAIGACAAFTGGICLAAGLAAYSATAANAAADCKRCSVKKRLFGAAKAVAIDATIGRMAGAWQGAKFVRGKGEYLGKSKQIFRSGVGRLLRAHEAGVNGAYTGGSCIGDRKCR